MPDLTIPRCKPSATEVMVVYCTVPEGETAVIRSMLPLLSQDERERALRFRFGRDRAAFSCAHLLLRRCLEQITGRPDWSFAEGPYGKPALPSALGSPALAFNISHTRGRVACALARGHEVGVDVETSDANVDHAGLAERNFSVREQRMLDGRTGADLAATFFSIWTMKEAVIKATGLGLQMPLDQFTVEVDRPAVRFDPALSEDETRWRLDCLRADEAWLAVAVRSPSGTTVPERFRWHRVDHETLLQPASKDRAPGIRRTGSSPRSPTEKTPW
jgi:4'-phosphopantetheinyl transferase